MPFDLELSPGLPALAGVMSVLHARRVSPSSIAWEDGTPIASLLLDVPGCDQDLLLRQLCRRVDVRGVRR
jgi:hypothetical protein